MSHMLSRLGKGRVKAAGGGVALLLAGLATFVRPDSRVSTWPTAVAVQAPLVETLVERGTVSAARMMLYSSRIPGGPAKITELVREGTAVAAGDVLIRFDSATFGQDLTRELAARQQAQAELALAREALHLEQLQVGAEVDRAAAQVTFAQTELDDQTHGAGLVELADLEAAVAEAVRETARARTALEDLKPLLAEGFITAMELERADQRWQKATEDEKLVRLRRDTFVRYGRPASVDKARAGVQAAADDLSRQKQAATARVAQRTASVSAAQGRINEIDARIALIQERLDNTVIRADSDGLVVYRDLFFGGDRRKPQVGDEVWPNQPVIALPDSSQLVVETQVREVDLHRLTAGDAGRSVLVRVDAYPDLRLRASVALVGALAQDDAARAGVKYFPVTIALDQTDDRLRTGMTARVEIEVAAVADGLLVPAQAVFTNADDPHRSFCFVVTHTSLAQPEVTRRDVTVTGDDGLHVSIGSGLSAGEVVLLTHPSTLGLDVREAR